MNPRLPEGGDQHTDLIDMAAEWSKISIANIDGKPYVKVSDLAAYLTLSGACAMEEIGRLKAEAQEAAQGVGS